MMDSKEKFIERVRQLASAHGGQKRVCEMTGIPPSTLNGIIKGKVNPSLKNYQTLMDAIEGAETVSIRRLGSNSPAETVQGSGLPTVPVLGSAGAGDPQEFWSMEPEREIQVLPQYARPGCVALRVDGDSMEPTIQRGAYVGVVPLDGSIREGGVYLVNVAPFGRLIKRIRMGEAGSIELISDNRAYPPRSLPLEQYDAVVVGRVVWVWQEL